MAIQKEGPLISITVPVYNTEKYLNDCIESILAQTYQNLEIILVDDGSTDRSGIICDEYQKRDARIQVIHKKNGGNTSARKAGVERASGDYIGFVDSDDWINKEMYEVLMRAIKAEDADLVMSGIFYEYGHAMETIFDGFEPGVYRDARMDVIRNNMIPIWGQEKSGVIGSLCTKLFKKECLWTVLREMDDAIQFAEDTVSMYVCLHSVNCAVVLNQAFYHYRQRAGSVVHIQDDNYLSKIHAIYSFFHRKAREDGYPVEIVSKFDQYIYGVCLQTPEHLFGCEKTIPTYTFPFDEIPANSRLILYGAGVVGKSYYNLIRWTNMSQIVGWIDRDYRKLQMENVFGIEILKETTYDYIVIAVQNESVVKQIKESIIAQGVQEQKILWFKPKHIFEILFQ